MNTALIDPTAQTMVLILRQTFGGNATIKKRGDGPEVDIVPDEEMARNIRRQAISFAKSSSPVGLSLWPIIRPYVLAGLGAAGLLILAGTLAFVLKSKKGGE